ncbi:hypothetical protein NUW58_g7040 [Xylaria curta]|uniref:Uncharacterized protein n=1 Tax=Xylaria curta TaxID=42375 RepID=A0ACC1NMN8_9PEZI|nr:hypothetical protein NUW58_g7040 [Xylaria curta]
MAPTLCENTAVLGKRATRRDQVRPSSKSTKNHKRSSKKDRRPRNSAVNWKDEKVWKMIKDEGYYHKSDEIIVSCGTVTINKADDPEPQVLVVYNNRIGIYQLPKGRKDIGEGHLDAAIRETTEETGIAVRPLRLRFGSRSTPSRLATATGTLCGSEDPSTGITQGLSNEMIGVSEWKGELAAFSYPTPNNSPLLLCGADMLLVHPDPATGAWRNIHWYAAKPCDSIERNEACMPIPDDREKFSTWWFSEAEALSKLKLEDEKFSKSCRKMMPDPEVVNLKVALAETSIYRIAQRREVA